MIHKHQFIHPKLKKKMKKRVFKEQTWRIKANPKLKKIYPFMKIPKDR